jgi:transposase
MKNVDQLFIRSIMLFEFDQKKSEMETYRKITTVYDKETISLPTVYNWFTRFRSGDRSLENKPLPGATPLIDKDRLQKLIEENPSYTLNELAKRLNVSKATVCRHRKDIIKAMKKVSRVRRELNEQN